MSIFNLITKFFRPLFSSKVVFDESKKRFTIYLGGKHVHIDGKPVDVDTKKVIEALKNSKKELFEEQKVLEFVREDQETDFDDLIEEFKEKRKLIKEIKPILKEEWRHCIELSFVYQKRLKRGQNEFANQTKDKIRNLFGEKGNRLCNLFVHGYFDEFIIPRLKIIKTRYDQSEALLESDKFIERILSYFPLAIFVNLPKTKERIINDIKIKLIDKKANFIDLHAVGYNNINKVEEVIEAIKRDSTFKDVSYTSKEDSLGEYKWVTYTLHKIVK